MMLGTVISIFLHLSLSGPVLPLSANSQTDSLTLRDTVKASRVTALRSAAVPMATMDRKTIEALPATTVADAIRYFSGAQIKDYGGVGGLKTVNVRSLGAQHTGVFYNGIKIVNAQNGQVDLGRFSTDNTESITLYQAQKADLLQTASDLASAASVYIKSVEPEKTAVMASYRTGAFGTRNPALYASYKGKVRAAVDASFLQANGRYKFTFHEAAYDTTATRTNGDIKALRAEARLYWKDFAVSGYLYSSERGLPGPVVRRVSEQYASKDRQWDRTVFVQGSWTRRLGKTSLQAKGKYTRDYCAYVQDPSKNAAVMPVDNRYWLLLEKPIAADWEDARRILHAARGSSRTIQLGFVLRYSHFYQKLHELSKRLGHIVMIQSNERLSFDHSSAYRRGWRRHLSATGGLMNEKCCHDLDIIRWLKKNHAEPVSVYSIGGYDLFPEHPEKPLYCEDCSDSKCVFRRDIEKLKQNLNVNLDVYRQCIYHTDADVMTNQSATILFDDGTQAIFTIALYAGSDEQRDIRILGTEGQLIGDLKYGRIELLLYRENTHEIFELPGGMHGDGDPLILDDFFRCIDEKKQPEATVEDGVLASRIAFAANLSVKERRIVNLDEFPL